MEVLAWQIQDYGLGSLTATFTKKDLVLGFNNTLVAELNETFPYTDGNSSSAVWKAGDAIRYEERVTPFIDGNSAEQGVTNETLWLTIETGEQNPYHTGRILAVNDHWYPNFPMPVNSGINSTNSMAIWLPRRCSTSNYNDDNVYTFQQNMPANNKAPTITTMNLMNMQMQSQEPSSTTPTTQICETGKGAACDGDYNSYTVNNFTATDNYYPNMNCGTKLFTHGSATQIT